MILVSGMVNHGQFLIILVHSKKTIVEYFAFWTILDDTFRKSCWSLFCWLDSDDVIFGPGAQGIPGALNSRRETRRFRRPTAGP